MKDYLNTSIDPSSRDIRGYFVEASATLGLQIFYLGYRTKVAEFGNLRIRFDEHFAFDKVNNLIGPELQSPLHSPHTSRVFPLL